MSKADGSIIIDTKIDQSGLEKGLNAMKNTAIIGAAAIAAGIAALSVVVVGLGSDFEQANAKASTLFGNAQVDMTAYQGKMLDLSSKTGLAATDLGNTMYDALSAGIPASDDMSEAIGYLEKNTKLAKAGFTDINTATTATAKVLNAYKMNVGETDRVHKVLMATQNRGITTVNELGSVLSQVTPTASAMSVSFEQVGASLANMTAQGTPTAQATTQLNQLFAELGKKGTIGQEGLEKAVAGTKHAGKSFQDLMKEGVPLNEILDLMGTYAEKNGLSLLDMFSSLDGGKAALALSGQNAEQFTSNLKEMSTEVDLVGDAYDKVTDTFKEKSAKVVNSLKSVGIQAYSKFEVPLKGAMDSAQKSVDSLSREMSSGKLSKSVDTIADGFADLIKVTVDIAEDALPAIINGFAFLVDHGKEVTVTLAAISGAMVGMKILPMIQSFIKAKAAVEAYNVGLIASTLAGKTFTGSMTLGQVAVGLLTGQVTLATAAQAAWNAVKALDPTMMVVIAVAALAAGIGALIIMQNKESEAHVQYMDEQEEKKSAIDKQLVSWNQLKEASKEKMTADLLEVDRIKELRKELSGLVDENGKVKDGYASHVDFILGEFNNAMGTQYSLIDGVIQNYGELESSIDNVIEKERAKIILDSQKDQYAKARKENQEALLKLQDLENEKTAKATELESAKQEVRKASSKSELSSATEKVDSLEKELGAVTDSWEGQQKVVDDCTKTITEFEYNQTLALSENAEDWKKINADIANSEIVKSEAILTEQTNTFNAEKKNLEELTRIYGDSEDEKVIKQREKSEERIQTAAGEGIALAAQQGIQNEQDLSMLDVFISTKQTKIAELTAAQKVEYSQQRQDEIDILNRQVSDGLRVYSDYVTNKVAKAVELTSTLNENSTQEQKDAAIAAREQAYDTLAVYAQNVQDKITNAQYLRSQLGVEGSGITEDMVVAAEDQAKKATEEYDKVASNTLESLNSKQADIAGIGTNYTEGFINGIKALSSEVSATGSWIGELAANGLKAFGIVKSPSRLMRGIGVHYGEGFVLGIEDEEKNVANAAKLIAESAVNEVNSYKDDMQDALRFDLKGSINLMPDEEINKLADRLNSGFSKISTAIPSSVKVSVEEELQKVKLLFGNTKNDSAPKQDVTINQTVQFMDKTESPSSVYRALQRATKKMANLY